MKIWYFLCCRLSTIQHITITCSGQLKLNVEVEFVSAKLMSSFLHLIFLWIITVPNQIFGNIPNRLCPQLWWLVTKDFVKLYQFVANYRDYSTILALKLGRTLLKLHFTSSLFLKVLFDCKFHKCVEWQIMYSMQLQKCNARKYSVTVQFTLYNTLIRLFSKIEFSYVKVFYNWF